MKGKDKFSRAEADQIRNCLIELRRVDKGPQKSLRAYLRDRLGFHILQFTNSKKGFTVEDFEQLVKEGKIIIK